MYNYTEEMLIEDIKNDIKEYNEGKFSEQILNYSISRYLDDYIYIYIKYWILLKRGGQE